MIGRQLSERNRQDAWASSLVPRPSSFEIEIEGTLLEHPMVGDAAVFGIPDPDWGEQVKAVLEPAAGLALDDVDTAVIAAFAVEHLAKYKLPATYDVVEQLPRGAHGKLKKRKLRDPDGENASG
jgi:long-chain acyl-CoA synthetase